MIKYIEYRLTNSNYFSRLKFSGWICLILAGFFWSVATFSTAWAQSSDLSGRSVIDRRQLELYYNPLFGSSRQYSLNDFDNLLSTTEEIPLDRHHTRLNYQYYHLKEINCDLNNYLDFQLRTAGKFDSPVVEIDHRGNEGNFNFFSEWGHRFNEQYVSGVNLELDLFRSGVFNQFDRNYLRVQTLVKYLHRTYSHYVLKGGYQRLGYRRQFGIDNSAWDMKLSHIRHFPELGLTPSNFHGPFFPLGRERNYGTRTYSTATVELGGKFKRNIIDDAAGGNYHRFSAFIDGIIDISSYSSLRVQAEAGTESNDNEIFSGNLYFDHYLFRTMKLTNKFWYYLRKPEFVDDGGFKITAYSFDLESFHYRSAIINLEFGNLRFRPRQFYSGAASPSWLVPGFNTPFVNLRIINQLGKKWRSEIKTSYFKESLALLYRNYFHDQRLSTGIDYRLTYQINQNFSANLELGASRSRASTYSVQNYRENYAGITGMIRY